MRLIIARGGGEVYPALDRLPEPLKEANYSLATPEESTTATRSQGIPSCWGLKETWENKVGLGCLGVSLGELPVLIWRFFKL